MITLYSSYNSIYIILSYILCYYGLLTSFNVISIFFVTKYFKSQNINIKESNEREFQLSEEVLRFLSIISLGTITYYHIIITYYHYLLLIYRYFSIMDTINDNNVIKAILLF